ncbi:MAG: NAD(P)-dependent alcohol dehydrogenase [Pedobacter sp.]
MNIKAAVVREKDGAFNIEDVELDEPRNDEVIVRVAGCGICHTDFMPWKGTVPSQFPAVYGHEGSGVVEKVGAGVKKVKPGDHVVMSFNSCGVCVPCRNGQIAYCVDHFKSNFGQARFSDGSPTMKKGDEVIHAAFFNQSSFATHALVSERTVVKIPNDAPLELMGPLGCGIQTGAGAVINSLNPNAGDNIAIFGTGSVGMSALLEAVVSGCGKIMVVDINEERLELARELGATHTINPMKVNAVEEIQKLTGLGADYSLVCTGNTTALRQAVDCIRLKGVCGIVGAPAFGTEISLDIWGLLLGRTVRGICQGDAVPDLFIPKLVDLYKQGRFPIDRIVKYYSLDQINEAVADTLAGSTIKGIVRP